MYSAKALISALKLSFGQQGPVKISLQQSRKVIPKLKLRFPWRQISWVSE